MAGKLRLECEDVESAAIVRGALDSVQPDVEAKRIEIAVEILDAAAGFVHGYSARLQQVLWNLLANAVKFTPVAGRIRLGVVRRGDRLEMSVTDSGAGIAAFLPIVFEPFRQADASPTRLHGLGLGLAIVKQLVEAHGGTIAAQSEGEGRGATFTVTLPAGAATVRRPAVHAEPPPSSLDGLAVLVVDDDDESRAVVAEHLQNHHAQVLTAALSRRGVVGAPAAARGRAARGRRDAR